MLEVLNDRARVYDSSRDVNKSGHSEDEAGHEVHDKPDGRREMDHAEMQGGSLPHAGEGEKSEGNGVVGYIPLHDPAAPCWYPFQLLRRRLIHHAGGTPV